MNSTPSPVGAWVKVLIFQTDSTATTIPCEAWATIRNCIDNDMFVTLQNGDHIRLTKNDTHPYEGSYRGARVLLTGKYGIVPQATNLCVTVRRPAHVPHRAAAYQVNERPHITTSPYEPI
jgi:hypothetical protein